MALKSALSSKVQEESLVVLDSMTMDAYKTKTVAAMLNALGAEKKGPDRASLRGPEAD